MQYFTLMFSFLLLKQHSHVRIVWEAVPLKWNFYTRFPISYRDDVIQSHNIHAKFRERWRNSHYWHQFFVIQHGGSRSVCCHAFSYITAKGLTLPVVSSAGRHCGTGLHGARVHSTSTIAHAVPATQRTFCTHTNQYNYQRFVIADELWAWLHWRSTIYAAITSTSSLFKPSWNSRPAPVALHCCQCVGASAKMYSIMQFIPHSLENIRSIWRWAFKPSLCLRNGG